MDRRLWLRWSWRDLRKRPIQVVVIALVIALGTGLATGLSSIKQWRIESNDASFALLRHHDVRATLPDGAFAPAGALADAAAGAPGVAAAREQLVVPTQVDASRGGSTVLVPGVLVGQQIDRRPVVDGLFADRGRVLRPADDGRPVAMVDRSFASVRKLPAEATLLLAGGSALRSVGWAFQPQYIIGGSGGLNVGASTGDFATIFTSLRTAQRVAGRRGKVNQVVVRARDGVAPAALERQLRSAIDAALPGVGVSFTRGTDEQAYRLLYRDAEGDEKVWRVLALLVLLGAALAAYNLTSRTVEAERREIGIGMAIGVPPPQLALRPLLMGAQIAILGAVFGIAIGLLLTRLFATLLENQLPLPVFRTPFQVDLFLAGAALGVMLPLLGVLLPVWRAVRMRPIDAIRIGFRAAAGGGLAPLLARVPAPGDTLAQMPVRNVARAPRRSLVTVLGIGVIVALVVSFSGLVDSFLEPLDRARVEATRSTPDRMAVRLDRFRSIDGAAVRGVTGNPAVSAARPQNELAVTLERRGKTIDAALTIFDPAQPGWRPRLRAGSFGTASDGIVLALQATRDLGVGVGDVITVRHPVVAGPATARLTRSRVRVDGIHSSPLRSIAIGATASWDRRAGLTGLTNQIEVLPAAGGTRDGVTRALFGREAVASVQAVAAPLEALDETMDAFLGYIYATEAFVLLLAMLVAYNSAAISADERRREHATMFAFGVPRRTVLVQSIAEGGIVGAFASAVGLGLGLLVVSWIVRSIVPQTFPELEINVVVTSTTLVAAAVIGVVACALTPLFTARRLRRMDIASTLRVME